MADIKAFNSEEFGWNDHQMVMLGRNVMGIRKIMYKESQEKTNVYGAGKKPIARTRSQKTYEASVTVLLSELVALIKSNGGKSVLDIPPFDIVSSFAPTDIAAVHTNRLVYCEFTSVEVSLEQGDQEIEIELPIIPGDIEWDV